MASHHFLIQFGPKQIVVSEDDQMSHATPSNFQILLKLGWIKIE